MQARSTQENEPFGPLYGGIGLVVIVLAVTGIIWRSAPPAPVPASAPVERFSADRAGADLAALLAENEPHPTGSPANTRVRERIIQILKATGYEPRVETGFVCGDPGDVCASVSNIVVELPGQESLPAVLLAAHHDSVPAGPGAGDAGAGVATMLEVARILRSGGAQRRPVWFLFLDGEEAGLLGARLFAETHPSSDFLAMINLEARGTSGGSALFETSNENDWLVRAYADQADRPFTNSALYSLYKLLPADTDFTIFKDHGYAGLNFAFADELPRYHSPIDDLEHLDPRSLQHHGDNALAAVRGLAGLDAPTEPQEMVFFDLFSLTVISWPGSWMGAVAIMAGLLVGVGGFLLVRRRDVRPLAVVWAALGWFVTVTATLISGVCLTSLLSALRGVPRPWVAHPGATLIALEAISMTVLFASALFLIPRTGRRALWLGCFTGWAMIGVVMGFMMPSTAYLFAVPTAGAGLAMIAHAYAKPRELGFAVAALVSLILAVSLWGSLGYVLWIMMGVDLSIAVTLPAALIGTALTPLLPTGRYRWLAPGSTGLVAVVAFVIALVVPAFSAERPQRVNLQHFQEFVLDSTGKPVERSAWWQVQSWSGPAPDAVTRLGQFDSVAALALPSAWIDGRRLASDAPIVAAPPPLLEVIEQRETARGRFLRLEVRSPAGGNILSLYFPVDAGLFRASINGRSAPTRPERPALRIQGLGQATAIMEIEMERREPVEVILVDETFGLPAESAELVESRPAWALPSDLGDMSVLFRRLSL